MDKALKVEIQSDVSFRASADIERSIFDLNTQIDMLSSHADNLDCLVAIASGLLCGMMDTIIGNCDSQIFLGGSEQTTLKDLNTTLGKETIDMYNTGETRGQSQSYNMNYQKLGHDLMSIDELAVMDGSKCIVQIRGVRPFFSDKYDLTKHPKYGLTSDADKRNWFDIEKFLKRRENLILKADDKFTVIEVNED